MKTYSLFWDNPATTFMIKCGMPWKEALESYRAAKKQYKKEKKSGEITLSCDQTGDTVYLKIINK